MLALSVVEEIGRLLKEGELSQRAIAAQLGVSRGTVGAIASGRRALYGRDPEMEDTDPHVPTSAPERCPECGYLVFMPCLVCRTREYQRSQKQLQDATIRPVVARPRRRRRGKKMAARRSHEARVA
jgi:hypothetical protein